MREESKQPLQAAWETPGGAAAARVTNLPTDADLIAFLRDHPMRSLAQICDHFSIPYAYSAVRPDPETMLHYGYTPEAKAVRNQLQRLRKARLIKSQGTGWRI